MCTIPPTSKAIRRWRPEATAASAWCSRTRTLDANFTNITYVPIRIAANNLFAIGNPLAIGDFDGGAGHDSLFNADIATLSTGRQVVEFERAFDGGDDDIFLNVVNAIGPAKVMRCGLNLVCEIQSRPHKRRRDAPAILRPPSQTTSK
jgi:hypothetical protein